MRAPTKPGLLSRWFPALGEPALRLYLIGQLVSVNGAWVLDITLNLLTWSITGSTTLVGIVNFLLFGPTVVVAPWIGARLRPDNARRATSIIIVCTLALAVVLAALAATGALTFPAIAALALLRGVLTALEMPARQVLLAASVRNGGLIGNAVAMNTVVYNVARMLGPGIAAALFAVADAAWGFSLAALTLAFMLGCVHAMPEPAAALAGTAVPRPGLRHAIAYVRADRLASLFMPMCALVGLFATGYQTLVPALADRVFGDVATWTGWLFAAAGAGSLLAGIVLSSQYRSTACRRWQIVMPWGVALALLGTGLAPLPQAAMACLFAMGFAFTFCAAGFNAGLQQRAPAELRGALIGLYTMCFMGAMPLGHLLAGAVAQWIGVREALAVMAAGLAVGTAAIFVPRWISLGRIEFDGDRI